MSACEPHGRPSAAAVEERDHLHHCITCGDDGVPMRVVRVDPARGLALCETTEPGPGAGDRERSTIETALVEPVAPGDTLLVHAGTALTRLEGSAA